VIDEAIATGTLTLPEKEQVWPAMLRTNLEMLPATEEEFNSQMLPVVDKGKFRQQDYGL
jgi:hypothetical protein